MTALLDSNWVKLITVLCTLLAFGFAIYQTIAMGRIKKLNKKLEELNDEIIKSNEKKNVKRCQRVFHYVDRLSNDLGIACQIVDGECLKNKSKTGLCGRVSAAVNSAWTSTLDLIDFCDTLNNEHKEEFGDLVDDQLSTKKLKARACVKGQESTSIMTGIGNGQ